jgi:DnaJ-domain-containing protein 1
MVDYFALLEQPRRPWLDPARLKEKFLSLSSPLHPDRVHESSTSEKEEAQKKFSELNAAYNVLKEPRERLLHLLELEAGEKPRDIQKIPPGTMDLFIEVGQTCRSVDEFLAEKNKVTSPLLRVKFFEQGQEWSDKIQALQRKVQAKQQGLEEELKALNSTWESAEQMPATSRQKELPLERLEQIYRVFSYCSRWTGQLQERFLQLAF